LLLLPGIYLNARNVLHLPGAGGWVSPRIPDRILTPLVIIAWPLSLLMGQLASGNPWTAALLLPLANILAIGLPILLYVRISLRGLELPTAKRGWSLFGASLMVTPLLAFLLEALALGTILLLFMLYASQVPGLTDTLNTLFSAMRMGSANDNDTMRLAAGLAFAPGVPFAMLTTFSLAIPVIEETIKITLIWLYLGRIRRPVDGFVLGILCGAAFALTENLGFASAGAADWTASAAARATAALPHIFNSGLLGWALVSAWREARYGRLAATFLAVVLVHGTWNAISLGIALAEFAPFVADTPVLLQNPVAWYAAWGVLALGSLVGLFLNNRRMRKQAVNS
jgi:RsiW-degrading membrane proteinase PrsW (M82 family)